MSLCWNITRLQISLSEKNLKEEEDERSHSWFRKLNIWQPTCFTFSKAPTPKQPFIYILCKFKHKHKSLIFFSTNKKSNFSENKVSLYRREKKKTIESNLPMFSFSRVSKRTERTYFFVSLCECETWPTRPTRRDADTHQCSIVCWAYRALRPGEGAQHDFGTRSKLHAHALCLLVIFWGGWGIIFFFPFCMTKQIQKKREPQLDMC